MKTSYNNKLISFINKQTHYKAGVELDIARNNTLIYGTYNPPKDIGYINNYRFSINNNKNNFLNFSKLLYEQTYNKLLNPEYRTIPVGIELNGLHKIVVDIDTPLIYCPLAAAGLALIIAFINTS